MVDLFNSSFSSCTNDQLNGYDWVPREVIASSVVGEDSQVYHLPEVSGSVAADAAGFKPASSIFITATSLEALPHNHPLRAKICVALESSLRSTRPDLFAASTRGDTSLPIGVMTAYLNHFYLMNPTASQALTVFNWPTHLPDTAIDALMSQYQTNLTVAKKLFDAQQATVPLSPAWLPFRFPLNQWDLAFFLTELDDKAVQIVGNPYQASDMRVYINASQITHRQLNTLLAQITALRSAVHENSSQGLAAVAGADTLLMEKLWVLYQGVTALKTALTNRQGWGGSFPVSVGMMRQILLTCPEQQVSEMASQDELQDAYETHLQENFFGQLPAYGKADTAFTHLDAPLTPNDVRFFQAYFEAADMDMADEFRRAPLQPSSADDDEMMQVMISDAIDWKVWETVLKRLLSDMGNSDGEDKSSITRLQLLIAQADGKIKANERNKDRMESRVNTIVTTGFLALFLIIQFRNRPPSSGKPITIIDVESVPRQQIRDLVVRPGASQHSAINWEMLGYAALVLGLGVAFASGVGELALVAGGAATLAAQ